MMMIKDSKRMDKCNLLKNEKGNLVVQTEIDKQMEHACSQESKTMT